MGPYGQGDLDRTDVSGEDEATDGVVFAGDAAAGWGEPYGLRDLAGEGVSGARALRNTCRKPITTSLQNKQTIIMDRKEREKCSRTCAPATLPRRTLSRGEW